MSEEARKSGGWFCYGRCRDWTELNQDREENVCGRCHQPTVELLPPQGESRRERAERKAKVLKVLERRFRYEHGRMEEAPSAVVKPGPEAHERFEKMRREIGSEQTEKGKL